ncbi:MAG: pantetheine-phosphate adenylyltransferase [Fusobacterium gastrosuis]|uniref:pantetheine-phosphate adenylyltransferase n=2 Tax=Fusobacteriaceae TaxID=203492 RepID=UPI001F4FD022|nr:MULTISPECIES: pantetheine-phosphate adenylyltransferase [Fusobacterium]MDD7410287.1 pantetheine-phosphate adenylyltransferase [Fusobacteriaceae bacterium]MCI5725515.1 pantetheine-phosphate adenylyltransferase [Fusobacterium sp.]MCI7224516.1 pantetheine-phosphate adenylyltransferase [Fusobacterium sp.]MDY4010594.1 pantetheine-phosphate adenylyltransferase [Fusobacterium gastrosuis]MDY5306069.1 pantetheine-phosphate adenylyltransferase [Fusobacterium gastrosuis]
MKIGVYAGSFDPITKGHQDIIERALKIVDRLIVVVMNNPKKTYWFDLEERKELIKKVFGENNKIEIEEYAGLLVEFMEKTDANLIIKGVRDMKDFSEEMVYSFANKELSNGKVDTIFIPSSKDYTYVSSTFVKEVAFYNQDLDRYADKRIAEYILDRAKTYR